MPKIFRRYRKDAAGSSGSYRQYLVYAVGEILLIVAGILIAVQVNTWNENRKMNALAADYTSSLLRDLQDDATGLEQTIKLFRQTRESLTGFSSRLSHAEATRDTLISIARNELMASMPVFVNYNLTTYETLQSTGNINLIEPELFRELRLLYQLHEEELYYRTGNMEILGSLMHSYLSSYPIEFGVIQEGPLYEEIWDNADYRHLLPLFNAFLTMKLATISVSLNYYETILHQTHILIDLIES